MTDVIPSEETEAIRRPSLWRRWVVNPVVQQLTQGTSPAKIAQATAYGVTLGIFPIIGSTTLLSLLVGIPLKLNPLAMKLLAILMQKSPNVVRREVLEEALWGEDCPDSDSLRSHIHQLRQVLDKPFATPLLHTLHGIGYRLAAP